MTRRPWKIRESLWRSVLNGGDLTVDMDNPGLKRRLLGRSALIVGGLITIIAVAAFAYFDRGGPVPHNKLYSVDLGADNGAIPTYSGPPPSAQQAESTAMMNAALPPVPRHSSASDPMAGSVADDEPAMDTPSSATNIGQ